MYSHSRGVWFLKGIQPLGDQRYMEETYDKIHRIMRSHMEFLRVSGDF